MNIYIYIYMYIYFETFGLQFYQTSLQLRTHYINVYDRFEICIKLH